jgi:anti-sigma regulatory factor (Ser/Thr protein kinase)
MNIAFPYTIGVKMQSDPGVIPAIRKFMSEALQVSGFSAKFAFRTEVIIDAVCNNAIAYGSDGDDSDIEVACKVCEDRVEVIVKDRGGSVENIERLREAVNSSKPEGPLSEDYESVGMGLEIVKLLSETIELEVGENNLTSIRVIRRREDIA